MDPEFSTAFKFPLVFRRSRKALRLRLQIDISGKITLVAPWYSTQKQIRSFVDRHEAWIQKHLTRVEKQNKIRPIPHYISGDTFYYFGEPLILEVIPTQFKRPSLKIKGDKLQISLYTDVELKQGILSVKKTIEAFYRKKAEETIHDRLQFFNEHYGFTYHRVTLRDQKSRWGSCSRAGNLNFNWRLIMAPIEVIDYVVVHELCHLKEMNHSHRFWSLVEEKIADVKSPRKWLKDYHLLLKT